MNRPTLTMVALTFYLFAGSGCMLFSKEVNAPVDGAAVTPAFNEETAELWPEGDGGGVGVTVDATPDPIPDSAESSNVNQIVETPNDRAAGETNPPGCGASALDILVTVETIRNSDGLVTAVLYDDNPDNFLKTGKRVGRERVAAAQGQMTLCLTAPGPGLYAIAVFHDEDGDKRLSQGFLGIPKEGFGFSNNPRLRMGPPKQRDTLFRVGNGPTQLQISLIYL